MQTTTKTAKIRIKDGNYATMVPCDPAVLKVLERPVREFELGGPTGCEEVQRFEACYRVRDTGEVIFSPGLLNRVRRRLKAIGYKVKLIDKRKPLTPDAAATAKLSQEQQAIVKAVAEHPLGRIESPNLAKSLDTVVALATAFPKARIAVPVASRRTAIKVRRDLEKRLREPVDLRMSMVRNSRRVERIAVGTFQNMPPKDYRGWDIMFFVEGESGLHRESQYMVERLLVHRRYAFVSPSKRIDDQTRFRLEQVAGEVIYSLTKPRIPVQVAMLGVPPCEVAVAKNPLQEKRNQIWLNARRNQHVADLARELAANLDNLLHQFFGNEIRSRQLGRSPEIGIVVESKEHAHELRKYLPDWGLLTWPLGTKAEAKNYIVTAMYAGQKEFKPQILIRATGTGDQFKTKGFPPLQVEAGGQNLALVFDFLDDFCPATKGDTQRRMNDYTQRGWRVLGTEF